VRPAGHAAWRWHKGGAALPWLLRAQGWSCCLPSTLRWGSARWWQWWRLATSSLVLLLSTLVLLLGLPLLHSLLFLSLLHDGIIV